MKERFDNELKYNFFLFEDYVRMMMYGTYINVRTDENLRKREEKGILFFFSMKNIKYLQCTVINIRTIHEFCTVNKHVEVLLTFR